MPLCVDVHTAFFCVFLVGTPTRGGGVLLFFVLPPPPLWGPQPYLVPLVGGSGGGFGTRPQYMIVCLWRGPSGGGGGAGALARRPQCVPDSDSDPLCQLASNELSNRGQLLVRH